MVVDYILSIAGEIYILLVLKNNLSYLAHSKIYHRPRVVKQTLQGVMSSGAHICWNYCAWMAVPWTVHK